MNGRLQSISTAGMSREEWLAERRKSIGGSDAAAIVGLSRWASPYTVWMDKTGRIAEREETEAMRIGRDLEEYVAKRFEEASGKKVRRCNYMIRNTALPWAHADIDRKIIGEDAGLECKTTSTLDIKQFRGVEFPEKYYAQCVHYLAVTGLKRWYLAVLVFGRGFFTYTLERDEAEIEALMAAEQAFWECVKFDTPPAPDGSEATSDALSTIYAESNGGQMDLYGRKGLLDEYMQLKRQTAAITDRCKEIENVLKSDMGEAERASCGAYDVRWKSQTRQTFQINDFRRDHPDMDLSMYYKASVSRPFKIVEITKEDGLQSAPA